MQEFTEDQVKDGAIAVYAAFSQLKGFSHPHAMNLRQWIVSAFGPTGVISLNNYDQERQAPAPVAAGNTKAPMRRFVHPATPGKQTPVQRLTPVAGNLASVPSSQPQGEDPENLVVEAGGGLSAFDHEDDAALKGNFGENPQPVGEENVSDELKKGVIPLTEHDIAAIGGAKSAQWVSDNYWVDQLRPFVVANGGTVTDKTSPKQLAQMAIIAAEKLAGK